MPDSTGTGFCLPRVKVCGLRSIDDLARLGPALSALDAVGLVEHPLSLRAVVSSVARALTRALPAHVLPVGVFVDRSPGAVRAWCAVAGARCVQLCGDEDPEEFRELELPILRRIAVDASAADELERWRHVAAAFVLDHPAAAGGTGRGVDPDLARDLARRAPCLLAGGLDADNVAARVRHVRPAGVDASSRLESAPGVKDPDRVARFVEAAAAALQEVQT